MTGPINHYRTVTYIIAVILVIISFLFCICGAWNMVGLVALVTGIGDPLLNAQGEPATDRDLLHMGLNSIFLFSLCSGFPFAIAAIGWWFFGRERLPLKLTPKLIVAGLMLISVSTCIWAGIVVNSSQIIYDYAPSELLYETLPERPSPIFLTLAGTIPILTVSIITGLLAVGIWAIYVREKKSNINRTETSEFELETYLETINTLQPDELQANQSLRLRLQNQTYELLSRSTPVIKQQIIEQLYATQLIQGMQPILDLVHVNLSNVDLSDRNLHSINLSEANLTDANLHRATLSHAHLVETVLVKADLRHIDLTGADLSRANLTEAELHEARLLQCNLTGAALQSANLWHANLAGSQVTEAQLAQAESIKGAILPEVEDSEHL